MADCVNALKEWTGKAKATVVFDSTVDEFTEDGLFDKVQGKRDIAFVGFTTDGDVFGGFYSRAVTKKGIGLCDAGIFVFSFESHGRCETPQRFFPKEELKDYAYVEIEKNKSYGFLMFGVVCASVGFNLGNERSNSWCWNMSRAFDGLEDTTLTGKNNTNCLYPPYHHCTRLVAVQLE